MGFTETVARIAHNIGEDGFRGLPLHPPGQGLLNELPADGFHFRLGAELSHGLAQAIRFPRGKTGDLRGDFNHLLLVEDHPIGGRQDFLQLGMDVGHLLFALTAGDERIHHVPLDGPGPD